MSRYIDADKLAKTYMLKGKDKLRLATVINELEIAPTEDVVPLVHASWVITEDEDEMEAVSIVCSRCGAEFEPTMDFFKDNKYCSKCGAKMGGAAK